jgi:hypothetical protein
MKRKSSAFPLGIIGAGIIFSLFLFWQIPDEIYYIGDAGIKALLAKQLGFGMLPPI